MKKRTWFLQTVVMTGLTIAGVAVEGEATERLTLPETEATPPGRPPQAYGSGLTVYAIPGLAMDAAVSDTTFATAPNGHRYRTGGTSLEFIAPVVIPSGGVLAYLELDACDTNASAQVNAFLYRCPIGGANCQILGSVASGTAPVPGCTQFVTPMLANPTVDNDNFQYLIASSVTGLDATTSLGGVRVGWRRQVSPAPPSATFGDVPVGHPIHRFVEALVAAGITGGCGGGNYCPDSSLTRGQMAVFLSTALGLHWPN